jgi:hypothetical protein
LFDAKMKHRPDGYRMRPAHRAEVRDPTLVRAIRLHRPDVGDDAGHVETAPDDAGAIVREEGPAAGDVCQPPLA